MARLSNGSWLIFVDKQQVANVEWLGIKCEMLGCGCCVVVRAKIGRRIKEIKES